jgi:DNA-binding NarL/FixJ family response regulator
MIKIYAVESQEVFAIVYQSVFKAESGCELLGLAQAAEPRAIKEALAAQQPDVLIIGTRALDADLIKSVQVIRDAFPRVGNVLLFDSYLPEGIKLLSKLARMNEAGMAVFLKRSLERVDQLLRIVTAVSERQFILDPALTNLLFTEKHTHMFLKGLTSREMEILALIAKGFNNTAIADALYIDIKTVRRHINSIYGKLKADVDFNHKHARVSATRLYLETTGDLAADSES